MQYTLKGGIGLECKGRRDLSSVLEMDGTAEDQVLLYGF